MRRCEDDDKIYLQEMGTGAGGFDLAQDRDRWGKGLL